MKHYLWAIFLFSFFSCQHNVNLSDDPEGNSSSSKGENQPVKVQVAVVKDTLFSKQIISNGIVQSKNSASLHFKQAGYVRRVNYRNGQKISKGSVIAVLENDLLRNAVEQARTLVEKARQKFEEYKIEYPHASSGELKIKSGLSEAEVRLQEAQIKYRQSFLKAPFSGTIANLKIKPGHFVRPSDTICNVLDNSSLFVAFQILPSDYSLILKNSPLEVRDFYQDSLRYQGIVTEINPQVSGQGLIRVRGKITDKRASLLHGMQVKVIINQPGMKMPVIPKTALVLRNNKEVVFTYEKGLAIWHYVEIYGENERYYAISKGLKPGDTVIVSNNINLAHEAAVKIEP